MAYTQSSMPLFINEMQMARRCFSYLVVWLLQKQNKDKEKVEHLHTAGESENGNGHYRKQYAAFCKNLR
jgi:hypothetical protein